MNNQKDFHTSRKLYFPLISINPATTATIASITVPQPPKNNDNINPTEIAITIIPAAHCLQNIKTPLHHTMQKSFICYFY